MAARGISSRRRWVFWTLVVLLLVALNIVVGIGVWTWRIWQELPPVVQLENWHPQEPLRIYADNDHLLQVVGPQLRYALPLKQIPKTLQDAFISAENSKFYSHNPIYYPVSFPGIIRAAFVDLVHMAPVQGASTITEQVARNFYLTPKKTITRKVAEILLAYKLGARLHRPQILDLYLNKIYLGEGAYGVQAAAKTYYGKTVNQLTVGEMATLAGLPAAPSDFNPIASPASAKTRRDYVLRHMAHYGYITKAQEEAALAEPIKAHYHAPASNIAPYATDWIRNWLEKHFGADFTYRTGLRVYTSINPTDQRAADRDIAVGLENYGMGLDSMDPKAWHGPIAQLSTAAMEAALQGQRPSQLPNHNPANLHWGVVVKSTPEMATVSFEGRHLVHLSLRDVAWARSAPKGNPPTAVNQVLQPGDLIWLRRYVVAATSGTGNPVWGTKVWHNIPHSGWQLAQIPHVQGALVSLASRSGAILALSGGFSYELSHFDRALYAFRQPGSGFKPFVYSSAMDAPTYLASGRKHYLTPVSLIADTPLVIHLGNGQVYAPTNYSRTFSNIPFPVWEDLADSHNVPSVRLLMHVGIPYAKRYVERFGIPAKQIPASPSMVLGSGDFTPLQIARGYAVFSSGGFLPHPYLIRKIVTAHGTTVSLMDCPLGYRPPPKQTVIPPGVAFLMTRMMERVIRVGTGVAAQILHRHDLAGKTGTTNHEDNAWFNGFNPDITTSVWVGYDNNQSMGTWAAGAREALPIWIRYMHTALAQYPDVGFFQPPDVVTVRYNPKTGDLAPQGDPGHQYPMGYFLSGYLPPKPKPKISAETQSFIHALMHIF
ncbi:PBP1A family penicillin-binding protein [Acidithiobacillus thiooxidans]|uniref:penicillin-binding protein 1A n=1 Tax=Acidithiobacillus thiooxidans TaxID=930 RepID=UPI0028611CD2|nr:PBP1A family penicillin-binding protein [Acidithiobacillus thiooxidans]MDR7928358.1 PBP1A family penicillin-binding protein [Acidithiobacillus thiooxidans]